MSIGSISKCGKNYFLEKPFIISNFDKKLLSGLIGNIVGGLLFIGVIYWLIYLKKDKKSK